MRKFNTILVLIIMALLLDHVLFGVMYLLGIGTGVFKPLAIAMLALVMFHAVISLIVTFRAEKAGFVTKARYNKENREFWGRRVSGIFIVFLALMHAFILSKDQDGVPRLQKMPKPLRIATPLLIIFVYLHLLSNIRPLLISFGIRNVDKKTRIIKIILTVIMLIAVGANIRMIISHAGGH